MSRNRVNSIKLTPDLTSCIETTARRAYGELLNQMLAENKASTRLKQKLEILQKFLDTADFRRLRSESEKHLVEGKKVQYVIHLDKGQLRYNLELLPGLNSD